MRGSDTVVLPYYQTETAPWKRERKLPEWTKEHAYTGTVNFGDNIRFDAEI